MSRYLSAIAVPCVIAGMTFAAGCNNPEARRLTRLREQKVAADLNRAVQIEQMGAVKTRADLRQVLHIENNYATATRQNMRELSERISYENKRWRDLQPEFARRIAEEINGKPNEIVPTALRMFN